MMPTKSAVNQSALPAAGLVALALAFAQPRAKRQPHELWAMLPFLTLPRRQQAVRAIAQSGFLTLPWLARQWLAQSALDEVTGERRTIDTREAATAEQTPGAEWLPTFMPMLDWRAGPLGRPARHEPGLTAPPLLQATAPFLTTAPPLPPPMPWRGTWSATAHSRPEEQPLHTATATAGRHAAVATASQQEAPANEVTQSVVVSSPPPTRTPGSLLDLIWQSVTAPLPTAATLVTPQPVTPIPSNNAETPPPAPLVQPPLHWHDSPLATTITPVAQPVRPTPLVLGETAATIDSRAPDPVLPFARGSGLLAVLADLVAEPVAAGATLDRGPDRRADNLPAPARRNELSLPWRQFQAFHAPNDTPVRQEITAVASAVEQLVARQVARVWQQQLDKAQMTAQPPAIAAVVDDNLARALLHKMQTLIQEEHSRRGYLA